VYADFYGFRTPPFHVTPDAGFLQLTRPHREAIGVLEYGLRQRKGFIVITGEVGVGKTTVLRYCLRRLDPSRSVIVYVLQPALAPHQLLALLWQELAESDAAAQAPWINDTGELIRHLLFRLKALHDGGKLIVIVIDEAQNMPVETLESLRLLSNLESDKQKFLQIVMAGQPELDDKLARRELRQLNQRIAVRTRLRNLSPPESLSYIHYRLERAAGRRVAIFTQPALQYLIAKSEGNPRRINILCDNALINGLGHRARLIGRDIVREAIAPHLIAAPAARGTMPRALSAALARAMPAAPTALAMASVIAIGVAIGLGGALLASPPRPIVAAAPPPHKTAVAAALPVAPIPPPAAATEIALAPPQEGVADAPYDESYRVTTSRTLAQLCEESYGVCGDPMIRALERANPRLDPAHLVAGETVRLPVIENLRPLAP
jgi:general secretion pathway protein A